jgi:excisionase family DNA binding protein
LFRYNDNQALTGVIYEGIIYTKPREDPMIYTLEQVADRLQVSVQTVRRLIKEGRLKAVRVGVQLRVTQEALDEFLKQTS